MQIKPYKQVTAIDLSNSFLQSKIEDDDKEVVTVNDDARSGAEVSASVNGKRKAVATAEMTNGALKIKTINRWLYHRTEETSGPLCRASPIVAKPPALVATIFPWDRDYVVRTGKQDEAVRSGIRTKKKARVTGAVPPVVACLGEGVAVGFAHRTFWKKVEVVTVGEEAMTPVTRAAPQVMVSLAEDVAAILVRGRLWKKVKVEGQWTVLP